MDKFDSHPGVVVMAQTQIAETYYPPGKLKDAGEKWDILLRTEATLPNHDLIHYLLILGLAGPQNHTELIGHAQDFLARDPDAKEVPHIRTGWPPV